MVEERGREVPRKGQERLGGVLLPPNKDRPAEDPPQREGSGEGAGVGQGY